MVGYEKLKQELADEGISVVAASVDNDEKTAAVLEDVSFPVAVGVTKENADACGAWWDDGRDFIQPSEFVLRSDGTVVSATYSSGPIGRMDAGDVLLMMQFLNARKKKQ